MLLVSNAQEASNFELLYTIEEKALQRYTALTGDDAPVYKSTKHRPKRGSPTLMVGQQPIPN